MLEILNLPIEIIKLYVLMFYIFSYKKNVRVNTILLLSCLLLSVSWLINELMKDGSYINSLQSILTIGTITVILEDKKKVLDVIFFTLILSVIDFIIIGVLSPFVLKVSISSLLLNHNAMLVVNGVSLVIIFGIVVVKKFILTKPSFKQLNLSVMESIILFICTFGFIILLGLVVMLDLNNNIDYARRAIVFSICIISVLLLGIVVFILRDRHNKVLNQFQMKFNEQQQNYNKVLLDKDESIRKFRHDISNHLYCIKHLSSKGLNDQLENYITDIEDLFEKTKLLVDTNNYIVDVIASNLIEQYKEQKIHLIWKGKLKGKLKVDDIDLSSVFSNILKNAFEATSQLNSCDKVIQVNLKYNHNNMIIIVENEFKQTNFLKNKQFLETTKINNKEHGFGSLIVGDVIKKYHGAMSYEIDNSMFRLEILLMDVFE